MSGIGVISAFAAGVLSFLSPCVLPLIPGYVSYISGASLDDIRASASRRDITRKTLLRSFLFVLGFSFVFVILGATATWLGRMLVANLAVFNRVSGVVIMLFGLHFLGVFKLPILNIEKRFHPALSMDRPYQSVIIGVAFAFGWTPCIGPILGAMLVVAGNQQTVWEGIGLLSAYSAGLGIPFIATALGMNAFLGFFNRWKQYLHWMETISGALLILLGVLLITGQWQALVLRYISY